MHILYIHTIYTYIQTCEHINLSLSIYIYIHMYTYMYTHTCSSSNRKSSAPRAPPVGGRRMAYEEAAGVWYSICVVFCGWHTWKPRMACEEAADGIRGSRGWHTRKPRGALCDTVRVILWFGMVWYGMV